MTAPAPLRIIVGDCREVLRSLDAESVQCCVTSPPYWKLRDYGTATWEGGDEACNHSPEQRGGRFASPVSRKQATNAGSGTPSAKDCPCGAVRVDSQIGLESTPEQYVAGMVDVFREVRRVLRNDGTLWLNLGDSYASAGGARGGDREPRRPPITRKAKDLVGIPWLVAFALQADGWWLRQDIIWHKPSPMPESVTDRCTKGHEYVFLFAKSNRYYFDAKAISEKAVTPDTAACNQWGRPEDTPPGQRPNKRPGRRVNPIGGKKYNDSTNPQHRTKSNDDYTSNGRRNRRSVWTIASQPCNEAHFATMPPKLARLCILAGCPTGGTVIDPFSGAGTTGLVASNLNRKYVGIELNPGYAAMSLRRIQESAPLFIGPQTPTMNNDNNHAHCG